MAEQTRILFYLFSFSHYILNFVDTSNCKAMISTIKGTCFFFTPVIMFVQVIREFTTTIYRGLITLLSAFQTLLDISLGLCPWRYISSVTLRQFMYLMDTD